MLLISYSIIITVPVAIVTMIFALDAIKISWWHFFRLIYIITYFANITIGDITFWIIWEKLLNIHIINYIAMIFVTDITITFALGEIRVNWWHFFCPKYFITLFAHVAIIIIALTFSKVEIVGEWISRLNPSSQRNINSLSVKGCINWW